MIEINDCIQHALCQNSREPLQLIDPRTRKTYVLLPIEVYEQLVFFAEEQDLDTDIDSRQVSILVDEVMREDDANDPWLESYQENGK